MARGQILAAVLFAAALFPRSIPAVEVREAHYVMGTVLEVTVEAPSIEIGRRWIHRGVAEARRLDDELTSFDPQSALCALNRQAGRGFQRVSPDLFEVVRISKELSRATAGAFDVTVGSMIELWRRAATRDRWPAIDEVRVSRSSVGHERIHLRFPDEIELTSPGIRLDLGGIGKGYAADRVAAILRALGATTALVNFGESSIVAFGAPPGHDGWPIWVRHGGALEGPLDLRDRALSTSRSFGHSQRIAGRRVGHIIDPRTGEPLLDDRQATVIAPSAAEAEGWSKALLLDPAPTLRAFASRESVAGIVFLRSGEESGGRFASLTGWRSRSR
jgi:thiamine biosynthesis lipoprotein